MAKGGYLILDLYKTPLTSGSATTIAGLWATLNKNKLKRVVLAGLYIGSALYNECDVEVKKDGTSFKFSAYGYDFTLTNADALTPVKNDSDIVLSKIKYDATNEELKIGATGKELLVGDDGDIHVNRDAYIGDEVVISSLQKIVDNDGTPFIPDSTGNLNKVLMHTTTGESWEKVGASSIDSGVATNGQVLKADGSGGVAWGDAGGGNHLYAHNIACWAGSDALSYGGAFTVTIISTSNTPINTFAQFRQYLEDGGFGPTSQFKVLPVCGAVRTDALTTSIHRVIVGVGYGVYAGSNAIYFYYVSGRTSGGRGELSVEGNIRQSDTQNWYDIVTQIM